MLKKHTFAAFAAVLLGTVLVEHAQAAAYPITATRGYTTVTGSYRPLNMDLTLVPGTGGVDFFQDTEGAWLSIFADYSGTFTGDGYAASGQAGTWSLSIDSNGFYNPNYDTTVPFNLTVAGNTVTMSTLVANAMIGTLFYGGGFLVESGSVPAEDTPRLKDPYTGIGSDFFQLIAPNTGDVLRVVFDDITNPSTFNVTLLQDLQHLGPWYFEDFDPLDTTRVNTQCVPDVNGIYSSCGSVGFSLSVPEPATLALFGIGLAGLALGRRRRN